MTVSQLQRALEVLAQTVGPDRDIVVWSTSSVPPEQNYCEIIDVDDDESGSRAVIVID